MPGETPSPARPTKSAVGRAQVATGLFAGIVCGSALTSLNFLAVNLLGDRPGDGPFMALVAFPFAGFFWTCGLLLIGGPAWVLLHRGGLTQRWVGALLGGTITPLCVLPRIGPDDILEPAHGMAWPDPAANLAAFGAIGAIVGWSVVHRAYRPSEVAR